MFSESLIVFFGTGVVFVLAVGIGEGIGKILMRKRKRTWTGFA